MTRLATLVLLAAGALALTTGACTTTTSTHHGQQDAGTDVRHQLDAPPQSDGAPQTDGSSGTCTTTGFTAAEEYAGYDGDYNLVYYDGYSASSDPFDWLSVGLYFDYGNPKPVIGPGTYTLGGSTEDRNFATCGTCVLVYGGCSMAAGSCDKTYFATSGTLSVTGMDNTGGLAGSLTNARLVEVTIDSNTGNSTEVPGGAIWCLTSYSFNQPLDPALPCTSNADCSGTPDTPYCDTDYGECVQCLEESHCTSLTATPHCDTDYGECVECVTDDHCASSSDGHFCAASKCGTCASMFDCTDPATPICQLSSTTERPECAAGPTTCTGEDAGDPNDDGPAGARPLTVGVGATGNVCDAYPASEYDFYAIITTETKNLTFTLTWANTAADLDLYVLSATGELLDSAETTANPEAVALTAQAAGKYYAVVMAYDMGGATDAIPYTLTLTTP